MQGNKSCGTKPEKAFARLLWTSGVRYRKCPKDVPGKPDFCIKKYRLAVFIDGEFWHGRDWDRQKLRLKGNRDFWIAKIERNIARDRRVSRELESHGWAVFRFWETEVKHTPGQCLSMVLRYLGQFTSIGAPKYIPADYEEYDQYGDTMTAGHWTSEDDYGIAAEPPQPYGSKE